MTFGEIVIVRGVYHRTRVESSRFAGGEKQWQLHEIEPRSGIYLGKRTLFNGGLRYDYEEGISFKRTSHLRAMLVIFNERENPVYCPLP